ncbi:MAG TPA: hypothetical protein VHB73_05580 [Alphaproteobacteria bacterium]|nr:hypothetical protein [Alphaproteobacteria bacterium]
MKNSAKTFPKPGNASLAPQLPPNPSAMEEDEAHDESVMSELRRYDENPGEELGTDESLNESNSAFSDHPSNSGLPKNAALSD